MARKLEVEIVGDASSFRRAVGQADSSSSKLGGTFGKLGKAGVFAAGAAGVGALAYSLKIGIGEFSESQKVAAQTAAVIKSTGGAAGVSAKQVDELSTSLMKKSGIDDEVIKSGENMLLTFTKIHNEVGKGNDIFDQATKATLDLSVATGKDMTSASVMVGKALQDPVKGLTALTRVGVSFTDSQKKQIEAMVKSGDTMGAQKIILGELNKEFGGSAEALGKTLPGQINIAKQAFSNWMGELVAKSIPVIQSVIGWLRDHWPEIQAKFQAMWQAVQPALSAFGDLVATVAGLIQKHWGTIGPILQQVANIVKTALSIITGEIKFFTALLRGDWQGAWNAVKNIASNAFQLLLGMFNLWKSTLGAAAKAIGVGIKNAIVNELHALPGQAWAAIAALGGFLAGKAGQIAGWGAQLGSHLLSGIKNALKGIGAYVLGLVRSAINGLIDRFNSLMEFDFKVHGVGFRVDAPDVPHLATGGIVTSPTLAVVGESGPEAVVPLGRGGGAPYQVNLQVDGRTLASLLLDPLRGEVRQLRSAGGTF